MSIFIKLIKVQCTGSWVSPWDRGPAEAPHLIIFNTEENKADGIRIIRQNFDPAALSS